METDLNTCKRCGQCMSVCPVYQVTFQESDVARGKLALLESVETGSMNPSKRLANILSRCLLCGACSQICANQVQTTRIIQSGRNRLFRVEKGGEPRSALFRAIRDRRLSAKMLLKGGALLQALICKNIPETSGLHLRFPLSFFTQRSTIPPIARRPFLDGTQPEADAKKESRRIGFFVGCGVNYLFPEIGRALTRILRLMRVRLIVPGDQVCCGLPAYVSGDTKSARDLAQRNIEAFNSLGLDAILTVCASCGSHLKTLPALFPDDSSSRDAASEMAQKHKDAMAFLVDHLGFETFVRTLQPGWPLKGPKPLLVAYHDPCHLRIGQGITNAPRRFLQALPGVRLAEAPHPGRCCGHGGEFNLSHFSLSMQMLDRRMADFEKVQPEIIATGCTGCLLQLSEGMSRMNLGGRVEIRHPLVLADQAIAS